MDPDRKWDGVERGRIPQDGVIQDDYQLTLSKDHLHVSSTRLFKMVLTGLFSLLTVGHGSMATEPLGLVESRKSKTNPQKSGHWFHA